MYILEGNVGAGKSTFLKLISEKIPDLQAVFEPVHSWQDSIYGQSLLTNFYEKPNRWAYTFETLTMMCRVHDLLKEKNKNNPLTIIERSVYSGFYCFAQNSYAQGFLNDIEWNIYQEWFSMLVAQKCVPPQGFIYLRISPEIAYERLRKRNRLAEKTVSPLYLKQIGLRHDAFLLKKEGILPRLKKVPVLTLDVNEDFESNPKQLHNLVESIKLFLIQTGSFPKLHEIPKISIQP